MYRIVLHVILSMLPLSVMALDPAAQPQPSATFTNSIGMEFVLIPAGKFMMGTGARCPDDDLLTTVDEYKTCVKAAGDEYPRHEVTVEAFYMGKYEVTQEQWMKIMDNNPAYFQGNKVTGDSKKHPVERASWDDAQQFVSLLNGLEKTNKYRLPTEAEWEYAARGGTGATYCFGGEANQLSQYAWFSENSRVTTHPVGQKKPNLFGLYDISGNVWEWTCSAYTEGYDGSELKCATNIGKTAVLRGCSWSYDSYNCRCANRLRYYQDVRHADDGMRVVADCTAESC